MEDTKKDICSGEVKMFNGVFGFLNYSEGDIFFHRSAICDNSIIRIGDSVSFIIAQSSKKNGKLQAENLSIIESSQILKKEDIQHQKVINSTKCEKFESNTRSIVLLIGKIKWYSVQNEYGVINANDSEYFFRKENINQFIRYNYNEGNVCIFIADSSSYKKIASNVFKVSESDYLNFKPILSDFDLLSIEIGKKIDQLEKISDKYKFNEAIQLIDILKLLGYKFNDIFDKFYEKCSSDFRLYLWYYNYTPTFESDYLTNLICDKSIHYNRIILDKSNYNNTSSSYDQERIIQSLRIGLYEKLFKSSDPKLLLDQILIELSKKPYSYHSNETINEYSGYDNIRIIAGIKNISQEDKDLFFKQAYEICVSNCKFNMWKNGYVKEKDVNIIADNLPYSLSEFAELFIMFENQDKLILLNKSLEKYNAQDLLNVDKVSIFTNSDFFSDAINTANKKNIFWLLWFFKIDIISADLISNEFTPEEFVKIIQKAKNKDVDYLSKLETVYFELSATFKLQLWLNNLYGNLNYIEFAKSFHELNSDDKKFFNKRIKEDAQCEQVKSFIDQIPTADLIAEKSGQKKYKCKWRNIYFNYQRIQVFLNKKESTKDFYCSFSRYELNLLTQEYFNNRRLDDIFVTVNFDNSIETIVGLESIETQIIFAEIRKNGSIESRQKISNEEVTRMIHNVGERNKCIKFLNEQNSPYNVVDIQELVTEVYGGLRRDISFLYCLPDNYENVYLIWESVEFEKSKATHIFRCRTFEVENYIDIIKKFLESTIHSRSKLNSSEKDDVDQKKELNYFGRVMHDSKEYRVWEDRMKNTLSFLK